MTSESDFELFNNELYLLRLSKDKNFKGENSTIKIERTIVNLNTCEISIGKFLKFTKFARPFLIGSSTQALYFHDQRHIMHIMCVRYLVCPQLTGWNLRFWRKACFSLLGLCLFLLTLYIYFRSMGIGDTRYRSEDKPENVVKLVRLGMRYYYFVCVLGQILQDNRNISHPLLGLTL